MILNILFTFFCVFISCLIVGLERPQWIIACLVSQSILVVIYIGFLRRIWLAYILFLVFLGGLLIIFVYVRRLVPRSKLESYKNKWMNFVLVCLSRWFIFILFRGPWGFIMIEAEELRVENSYIVRRLTSLWRGISYLYVVFYLLFTLYCVCFLIKANEGPLRLLK